MSLLEGKPYAHVKRWRIIAKSEGTDSAIKSTNNETEN